MNQHGSMRHPTPSTGVSTKFNNPSAIQMSHADKNTFQKHKEKKSTHKKI